MQVSIQNDAGEELAPLETGEVCVIGPAVFVGYFNNPSANASAFRNGFFRTGDYGYVDADGFLYLTGRASDMYISGGYNIYPFEIEEVLLTHPQIAEVAVVGAPDNVWGEVGVAVCVLRAGTTEAPDIASYLVSRLPKFKIPKKFFFWSELPKSGYGKVPKALLRNELKARGLLDDASLGRTS
jgi:fatty-acyl-CoA synthase